MKKLLLLFIATFAISCTSEPAQKCEKIIQTGWTSKNVCVIILESERMITVPCGRYQIGETYCE